MGLAFVVGFVLALGSGLSLGLGSERGQIGGWGVGGGQAMVYSLYT